MNALLPNRIRKTSAVSGIEGERVQQEQYDKQIQDITLLRMLRNLQIHVEGGDTHWTYWYNTLFSYAIDMDNFIKHWFQIA